MLSVFDNSSRTLLTFNGSMYLLLKHGEGEALASHTYYIIFQHTELLPCSGKLTNTSNKNSRDTIIMLCGRKNFLVKMMLKSQ